MDNVWRYMQSSGAYERHHIIAITRAMAKGYVRVDLNITVEATEKLEALGLTVVPLQGSFCRVSWSSVGFINDDPGYIPKEAAPNRYKTPKMSKQVKMYKRKSADAWVNYITSTCDVTPNKNGIARATVKKGGKKR